MNAALRAVLLKPRARGLIFDTDFGPDCDDAGDLAMLHALAARGEAHLLGAVIDTTNTYAPGALDAVDHYYGHPSLPVGSNKGAAFLATSTYTQALSDDFANDLLTAANAAEGVALYKRLLRRARDGGVKVVAAGPLNMLAALIADAEGLALVRAKVSEVVVCAGVWPTSSTAEWNMDQDRASASAFVAGCPVTITFAGTEMGDTVLTGSTLSADTPSTDPVRRAYEVFKEGALLGRQGWAQFAVLYAARGLASGGTTYFTRVRGTGAVSAEDGNNTWADGAGGPHGYLVKALTDAAYADLFDGLLTWLPADPLVRDDFTGANGTALSAHAVGPYNAPACSWAGQPATLQGGAASISHGAAPPTENVAWIDPGVADVSIRCDLQIPASGTVNCGVAFNVTDSQNYWAISVYLDGSNNALRVHQLTDGVFSQKAANVEAGIVPGQTYTVRVAVQGDTITALGNTARVTYTATGRELKTNTKCGIKAYWKSDTPDWNDNGTLFNSFQVLG